jgi:hypothetical protein
MAMKKTILICTGLVTATFCLAQGVGSPNDINAVKRDTSYIYGESTMKDVVEAQSGAKAILELKVSDWVRRNYPNEQLDTCLQKINGNYETLSSQRGNYYRVLLYVKKHDIVPEPILNEDVALENILDDFVPVVEEPEDSALLAIEGQMASILTFDEIEPFVVGLKKDGRIHAYGKYASLPVDAVCQLFVYDRDGIIVAVLRQKEDGTYLNLRTKERDNVRNYKNCGAIWLQLK